MGLILDKVLDIVTGLKCINDDFNYDPNQQIQSKNLQLALFKGITMKELLQQSIKLNQKASNDTIGTENDEWLYKLAKEAAIIVAAWGNDGSYLNRSREILGAPLNLHCLKMNKSGEPAHPLYLKADLKPVPMGT